MRKNLPMFLLVLFLLCGFSAHAEELIYPQAARITLVEKGNYKLSFEENLDENERWAWFACPDQASAEDLMEVMRSCIEDGSYVRSLTFDNLMKIWPEHGVTGISNIEVPAGSGYVFYGKAYCSNPSYDQEQGLFMISLGGTNLSKIKPGEIGGNDLMDGGIILPQTGDSTNPFLLASLLAMSSLGMVLLIKRSRKIRAVR